MTSTVQERVFQALDQFRIEIPSWGFANTGTRFGKYLQPGAATTIEEKFADAGRALEFTGISSSLALHVLWDCPNGVEDVPRIEELVKKHGIRAGSINPNLFQEQGYKFGSIANPDSEIRAHAVRHLLDAVEIGRRLGSRDVSLWIPDGSNYPGTQSMRKRIEWLEESLAITHSALGSEQRMLIEYKPFEPAFYHTDVADWGMALELARQAGPQAKVLVDTGHHYQGTNIEQVVTWLLHTDRLGGFHFNDRKYADDDLTLGSIDPYQLFRIFHELLSAGQGSDSVAFMIDQSHNLKGKMEATLQSIGVAQELYARAALVDRERLSELQRDCKLVEAEECFRGAFWTDVRPLVRQWRESKGLPCDPLKALAESGYVEAISRQRGQKNATQTANYA
jgi:L-rhamnose isomerase/sugar isomerase